MRRKFLCLAAFLTIISILFTDNVSFAQKDNIKELEGFSGTLLHDLSVQVMECPREKCEEYQEEAAKVLISDLLVRKSGEQLSKFLLALGTKKLVMNFLFGTYSVVFDIGEAKLKEVLNKVPEGEFIEVGVYRLGEKGLFHKHKPWDDIWGIVAFFPCEDRGLRKGEVWVSFYSPNYMTIKDVQEEINSSSGFLEINIRPIKLLNSPIWGLSEESILNQNVRPFVLTIRGIVYEKGDVLKYKLWGETIGGPTVTFLEKVLTVEEARDGGFDINNLIRGGKVAVGEGALDPTADPTAFQQCYERNGGDSVLGHPTNKVHPWGDGYIQDFQGGEGHKGAIMQLVGSTAIKGVYVDSTRRYMQFKTYAVYGGIWEKYVDMGGATGPLGFPLSDEKEGPRSSITNTRCRYSKFEGGAIVHRKATEGYESKTVFLGHGIFNKWEELGYGASKLGLPINDEYTNDFGYPQVDFESGYITTSDRVNFQAFFDGDQSEYVGIQNLLQKSVEEQTPGEQQIPEKEISIQDLLQKQIGKPPIAEQKPGIVDTPEAVTPDLWQPATLGAFATSLVIDKSGSMSGEKIKRAKDAAYGYVDVCRQNQDLVSLVAFASNAVSISEPTSIVQGRATLQSDILAVYAGGSTNIGSGVDIAHGHLSSSNAKNKVAVLMSDGQHNTGTYKPEVQKFIDTKWPIYTVAFGQDADQETLNWIAYQTGGLFFPSDVEDIVAIYNKIHIQAHNGSVLYCYNDYIRPGETLTYYIPVDPDMKKVGFFTNWQGSRMETTLTSPSGQVLNHSNFSQWGRFSEEPTYTFFEMDNPQPGNWQAQIVGYNLPSDGEQVNFHSFCKSDLFSNILGFQPSYSSNEQVRVAAKVAEVVNDQLSPLRSIDVTAEIKKPSTRLNNLISKQITGITYKRQLQPQDLLEISREISNLTREITLYDDGRHGDVNPGDGIYANTYNDTTSNGPYLVTVSIQGYTSRGSSINRTLQESFQIGAIEQNSFTISDFLALIVQQGTGRQVPQPEPKTEEVMKSLLDQLLKK